MDSKETKDEEESQLIKRRKTGVVIEIKVHKDSDDEDIDHSKKLKGVETMSETAKFVMEMKQVKMISNSNNVLNAQIKTDDTKKADAKKAEADKTTNEKARKEQIVDDQVGNEQGGDVQDEVHVSKTQIEKLAATLISSSLTLSSVEYGN
nr:hypothetical protein [Tanacetum cinerariifolium]